MNTVKHPTEKRAKDAARNSGRRKPAKDAHPPKGGPTIIQLIAMAAERKVNKTSIMNFRSEAMRKSKKHQATDNKLWIGLAKVEQPERFGPLGDADRAYTNAIGNANNRLDFRNPHQAGACWTWIKPDPPGKSRVTYHPPFEALDRSELKDVARRAAKTDRVGFGTFHAFDIS